MRPHCWYCGSNIKSSGLFWIHVGMQAVFGVDGRPWRPHLAAPVYLIAETP